MPNDQAYYESWLRSLELQEVELTKLLDLYGAFLEQCREYILDMKAEGDLEDFLLGNAILQEIHHSKVYNQYQSELEEIRLDRSHAEFMIALFKRSQP